MKNKVIQIDKYSPKKDDCLFFDTNIWLYLLAPTPPLNKSERIVREKVGTFYKKVLQSGARVFVSSLVISEFFNAFCRIRFNFKKSVLEKEASPEKISFEFKRDFRPTQEYCDLVKEVIEYINLEILDISSKVEDCFPQLEQDNLLQISNSYDFNDKYISELCSLKKFKIVTADKDYLLIAPRTDLVFVN